MTDESTAIFAELWAAWEERIPLTFEAAFEAAVRRVTALEDALMPEPTAEQDPTGYACIYGCGFESATEDAMSEHYANACYDTERTP